MTIAGRASADLGWRPRLTALADAQSRYSYLLGAAGVFFFALYAGLDVSSQATPVQLVRVQVSTALVLATGPTVLGFLIQAVTGSIAATETAAWRMAVLEEVEFEREYTAPNAIDLAFYTTDRSPAWVRAGGLVVYPAYLTAFLAEGAWLTSWLGRAEAGAFKGSVGVKWILFALGLALLLTALPRLAFLWWRKVSHAWVLLRHRKTPVRISRAMTALADISDSLRGAGHRVESRFEGRSYRLYVDDERVAWGHSLQELTVRTREWVDRQVEQSAEGVESDP